MICDHVCNTLYNMLNILHIQRVQNIKQSIALINCFALLFCFLLCFVLSVDNLFYLAVIFHASYIISGL